MLNHISAFLSKFLRMGKIESRWIAPKRISRKLQVVLIKDQNDGD